MSTKTDNIVSFEMAPGPEDDALSAADVLAAMDELARIVARAAARRQTRKIAEQQGRAAA